jgi:hypothetical protein
MCHVTLVDCLNGLKWSRSITLSIRFASSAATTDYITSDLAKDIQKKKYLHGTEFWR